MTDLSSAEDEFDRAELERSRLEEDFVPWDEVKAELGKKTGRRVPTDAELDALADEVATDEWADRVVEKMTRDDRGRDRSV